MKLAALFSGGKDSTLAMYKAMKEGHEISCLVTVISKNPESYMYHTENISFVKFQARALDIPQIIVESKGEQEKEVDDLKKILSRIRKDLDGIVCGAVKSMYQFSRIKKICDELKLEMIAPLWHYKPEKILSELIEEKFNAIIISVKAEGFDESWLGRRIDGKCLEDLLKLNKKYGIHTAGEGGEYESFVIDGPIFKKKVEIVKSKKKWSSTSGELIIEKVRLVKK